MAKALALGADAVAIGHAALMALNCNKDIPEADYKKEVGVEAGYCYHCHTGRCPVGVTTQDPELRKRLDPDAAAERVYNFLHTLTMECQMMARACGKTNVHQPGAGRPGGAHHGGLGAGHGAARRHAAHRRPARHDPLLGERPWRRRRRLRQCVTKLKPKAAAKGEAKDPKHIDHFLKTAGLDTAREKEIGQHIGYRYDVNLLPDYKRLTPFLKKYMELMGWDDLNWLEDVHMGYEEGRPRCSTATSTAGSTVPPAIKLPDNQQDRDMIARELLIKFQMSRKHPLVDLKKAYAKF